METLGSLLDQVKGLFSKGFLLAGLLPATAFVLLNFGMLYWIYPEHGQPVLEFVDKIPNGFLPYGLSGLMLLVLLGFVFWSLNAWLRQFLEGRYLPRRLDEWMTARHVKQREGLEDRLDALDGDRFNYRVSTSSKPNQPTWKDALRDAVSDQSVTRSQAPDARVAALRDGLEGLQRRKRRWEVIPYDESKKVFDTLHKVLRESEWTEDMDKLHKGFLELHSSAAARVEKAYAAIHSELQARFPEDTATIGATTMANLAQVHRGYGLRRYGIDIEFLWLRLLKTINKDTQYSAILEDAKTQLDFSVAMTSVVAVATLTWAVLSLGAESPWPFGFALGFGPIATAIFYKLTVQSYRTFTEAVRGGIDLHRFSLLKELHLTLPENAKEERETWQRFESMPMDDDESLQYTHKYADEGVLKDIQLSQTDGISFLPTEFDG